MRQQKKKISFSISSSHIRSLIFPLFLSLIIFLPKASYSVEGMDVNITYPLTPPRELFGDIKSLQYVRSHTHTISPIFRYSGEINKDFNYNTGITTGFSYLKTQFIIEAEKRELSIFDCTKTDNIKSLFNNNEDSLSLQYKNTTWYGFGKEISSFVSYFVVEKDGNIGEFYSNLHHINKKNEYDISFNFHRLYGYANMLSVGFLYSRSTCLLDREKMLQVEIKDRFAYRDYLFVIPGIKAEFISLTLFTPFFHTVYLINKNISLKAKFDSKSYGSNIENTYHLPYITFPESLNTPVNIIKTSLEMETFVDTSFLTKICVSARKTQYPIIAVQEGRYLLSYENIDTTITFVNILFDIGISRWIVNLKSNLLLGYTPFYKETVPYFPRYRLLMDVTLYLTRNVSLENNIHYTGFVYDSKGNKIEPYYIISSSLALKIMENATLDVGAFNITDSRKIFIGSVHFSGRIIKTGINIYF